MADCDATIINLAGVEGFLEAIKEQFPALAEMTSYKIKTCEDAIELIKASNRDGYKDGFARGYEAAVRESPQIVRCKDCQHHFRDLCTNMDGACYQSFVDDDWYCADGERE